VSDSPIEPSFNFFGLLSKQRLNCKLVSFLLLASHRTPMVLSLPLAKLFMAKP